MTYNKEQLIQKARELPDILQAYESLVESVNAMSTYFSDDAYASSYWLASLKIATSSDHGYVTRDSNAGQAISQLGQEIQGLLEDDREALEAAGVDITELIDAIEQCLILGEE
jgi:hypothetical protein